MVDYNNFAKTFSQSRKNMKWAEISYFLSCIWDDFEDKNIIDIWCGSGRLLWYLIEKWVWEKQYIWYDLSAGLLQEAKKDYPEYNFVQWDMKQISQKIHTKLDYVFLLASFHHLDCIDDRINVMQQIYDSMNSWATLYMTNWSLESELNQQKYSSSKISQSENKWGSSDFSIKIWDSTRYYHSFSLTELEHIFSTVWFDIIENREFDNQRNIISILKKQ